MKYLFFLGHDGFIRNFEPVLVGLAERGHFVHLALTGRRETLMSVSHSVEELCATHPSITWDRPPKPRDQGTPVLEALSRSRNYLRYLEPEYADAAKLRERAAGYAPALFRRFADRALVRSRGARGLTNALLASTMRQIGTDPAIDRYLRDTAPDAVLFTPLVGFGLGQHSPLRSAKRLRKPTALLVHSWDNLTNKGLIHELPDRVVVWNDAQALEARELHRVPPDRIVVTGAQAWDEWFDRRPSRSRQEFCEQVGLDAARPFVLYVGSSGFIAPGEARFVERWLHTVRSAEDPRVRELGVVLRPHPQNEESWAGVELAECGRTVISPPLGGARSGPEARAGFFDSIFHAAAVVGINTSALIESAIVGRPVLTVLDPEFRDTQEGTLHFRHLTGGGAAGGMLAVARSFDEHLAQLGAAIDDQDGSRRRGETFVASFVRPHGIREPATPRVLATLESLAASPSNGSLRRNFIVDRVLRRGLAVVRRSAERERARAAGLSDRGTMSGGGKRLLFFMRAINYDRLFEGALRELLARGHRVHVLLDVQKRGTAGDASLFEALQAEFPQFSYAPVPDRNEGPWEGFGSGLRYAIDYLRYLEPLYDDARALRERARARAPRIVVSLGGSIGRARRGRRALTSALRVLEAALPTQRLVQAYVQGFAPDAVLVTPLVGLGSPQGDYVRAARLGGAGTAFPVASWDNLTNKGVIRDVPDLTIVWNEAQLREAVELHAVPLASVVVAGAHSFDHWFDWQPSTDRETFCARLGIDSTRPYLLYVGSSQFIARHEAPFVAGWIDWLRRSAEQKLRDANVVVRPHPANFAIWNELDPSEAGRVVVYPRDIIRPTTVERKAEYYDSIYHSAAVVGINTSALVESAILGKTVFTITAPEFRDTQEGTLHFAYLTGKNGTGLLRVARDFDEHERQLAAELERRGGSNADAFVADFLRPHGREVAGSPLLADAVEGLAGRRIVPARRPVWHLLVRLILTPLVHAGGTAVPQLRRLSGASAKKQPGRRKAA